MILRHQYVPAFGSNALAARRGLDLDLLAHDLDTGVDVHPDGAPGAVDFDDHGIARIGGALAGSVVDAVDAGLVPGIEDRLPMDPVGGDAPNRHLDADAIARQASLGHATPPPQRMP